ncbi:collagen-like protein [Archangium violaceum]|uniref:collagen-like protein n=1 Tax=Archangium violaceum TaxID=83451 RepID=UPI0036D9EA78
MSLRCLSLAVLLSLSACTSQGPAGPVGPQGPQGLQGPQGPQGPAAGGDFSCAPNTAFCDGNRVAFCTRSGKDAVSPQACGSGTTTNPVACHTDKCGNGSTACCRPLKPTCAWNIAEPAITGEYYEGASSVDDTYCTPPSSCGDTLEFTLTIHGNPDECGPGSGSLYYSVEIDRTVTVGEPITLPDSRVSITYNNAGDHCPGGDWVGSATLVRTTPDWAISLDVSCERDATKKIKGDFSGAI